MKLSPKETIVESPEAVPDKKLEWRLKFAGACNAILLILALLPYRSTPKLFWEEIKTTTLTFLGILVPSMALIVLLPVFTRGSNNQRIVAAIFAVPAAYFAYQAWEGFIWEFFVHGY